MQKITLSFILLFSMAYAKMCVEPLTPALLKKNIKIVDIRLDEEWRTEGYVKGSILLTFFKKDGSFDLKAFANALKKHVKPGETVAFICRTGSRTAQLTPYLAFKNDPVFTKVLGKNPHIIDLFGGIVEAQKHGISLIKKQ